MIESVSRTTTNQLFHKHSELLFLLQHHFFPCSSKGSPTVPLSRLRSAACILSSTCSS
ncbi:hypothetical protein BGY98DRAFT_976409, partial [Russula aff. rugulosa BPL654]